MSGSAVTSSELNEPATPNDATRSIHAQHHARPSPVRRADPAPRQHHPRHRRGRDLGRRRVEASELRRGRAAQRSTRARAARARHRRRSAGGHLHVEQRRTHGGLPGGAGDGGGAAHPQHPVVPRAAGLCRQSRRGPDHHRRPHAAPAAQPAASAAEDGEARDRQRRLHRRRRGARRRGRSRL